MFAPVKSNKNLAFTNALQVTVLGPRQTPPCDAGARRLPYRESSGAAAAPRQRAGVGGLGVPDTRAAAHGGDANGARGGVVVAGVR